MHVPRRQAIRHGKSRKGPWHMAKTIASGVGMTNDWLASQGVLSLKTLWAELAHIHGTAAGLLCVEATRPDQHAWWRREGTRKRASLPDLSRAGGRGIAKHQFNFSSAAINVEHRLRPTVAFAVRKSSQLNRSRLFVPTNDFSILNKDDQHD